jgi:hypothetical protein
MHTTTTTVNALKSVNAQKWSESDVEPNYEEWFNYEESSDEPQSYYSREDTDTATLTNSEQRRIQCYYANAQRKWRNADEENDMRVVAAAKAIVHEIRASWTTANTVAATEVKVTKT